MNTFEIINNQVSEIFEVSVEDIVGKSRKRHVILARYAAMYIARDLTNCILSKIGIEYNRDHSTVISALKHAGYLDNHNLTWSLQCHSCWIRTKQKLYDT